MQNSKIVIGSLGAAFILSGCAAVDPELVSDSRQMVQGTGTPVLAAAETVAVGTAGMDAADDPEIWVNPYDANDVVIFATDKKAGLYAFGLDGKVLDFAAVGPLNNVDIRSRDGQPMIAASDRARNGVAFFGLGQNHKIVVTDFQSLPTSEAYGFCQGSFIDNQGAPIAYVIMVGKNGDVAVAKYNDVAPARLYDIQRFEVGSQSEGCVVDDRTGTLYIAEENRALWAYALTAPSNDTRTKIEAAPSAALKPDIEGLTILSQPDGKTYLIASSQGDSAFAVWDITTKTIYKGRFSVVAGHGIDAVTGTDGVAAYGGPVGPYSEGIVVMQDDADTDGETSGASTHQNFKIVDWRAVKAALNIN